jgi:hypothetical protein
MNSSNEDSLLALSLPDDLISQSGINCAHLPLGKLFELFRLEKKGIR